MKSQLRKIFAIQAFNSLVGGILFIVLPLLMRERNIGIVEIGLIYASLPLVFQAFRLFFAIISDLVGRKKFFILNSILNFFTSLIYILAYNPFQFLAGKITEGIKSSALWSVNRASILDEVKNKERELRKMRAIGLISRAIAILACGFLLFFFSLSNLLLLCSFLSLPLIGLSLILKPKKLLRKKLGRILDLKEKSRKFKKGLILFTFLGLSYGLIGSYILPLFLKEKQFPAGVIGILLGIQLLAEGISTYEFSTMNIRLKNIITLSIYYSLLLFLIALSPNMLIPILLLLLGISSGIVTAGTEGILSEVVGKYSYGTDIGIIFMSFHLAKALILSVSGFIVLTFGFSSIFFLASIIFLSYILLSIRLL